jgi:CBS domain-containing protein
MLEGIPLTYGPGAHAAGHVPSLVNEVQKRAYELFQERKAGLRTGSDADDWFAAEAEVLARHGRTPRRTTPATAPADPAGTAWSRLSALTAADIMSKPVIAITADCPLPRVVAVLREHGFGALPVVSSSGEIIGVISATDIVRTNDEAWQTAGRFVAALRDWGTARTAAELAGGLLDETAVDDTCSRDVVSCGPEASLVTVATLMAARRVHRVFVLDGGTLSGVVTSLDLARTISAVASS